MQILENSQIEIKEMSIIEKIGNIFFEPTKVFRNLSQKPKNIVAILMLIVLSILIFIPQAPYIETATRNNNDKIFTNERFLKTNPGISKELIDNQLKMSGTIAKVSLLISPFIILLFILIQSSIFLGLFKMFGGKGNFKQTFSVLLYSYFIVLIGWIAKTISVVTTGNVEAGNSFAFLMANDKTEFIYNFVSNIDFFYIWSLIVTAIGLSIIHKVSTKKSMSIVFITWLIMILGYSASITIQAISMYDKYGIIL